MFNIKVILPAFTGKQYNGPVIQTHYPSGLYPLSGIWQELGPHYGGISSERVARDEAFDNLVKYQKHYQFNLVLIKYKSMIH